MHDENNRKENEKREITWETKWGVVGSGLRFKALEMDIRKIYFFEF